MPPFLRWAELPPELLGRIGDSLGLKSYASARGTCTVWRRALAPPSPSLLLVPDDAGCCRPSPSAASLSTHRAFELKPIPEAAERVVGSSNGWLALVGGWSMFSLFDPITATEIALPPMIQDSSKWVSKLVFAPGPAGDDFAAAAIYGTDRLAYVTAGARRWAVLDPLRLARGDHLTDLLYHEKGGEGRVYCLTSHGDVHVIHLPERRRREPVADEPSSLPTIPILHRRCREISAPQRAEDDRRRRALQQLQMIHRRSFGPDLNAPATVDPLLPLPFDAAASFAPPYKNVSDFTGAKHLVFCEGNLYQIWRNSSCMVTVRLPGGGGRRRVAENEVFVLRYYPDRQPCWDAVTDLGGYSVFVGRNNAVSMPNAEGVPGLKGNCVYWIGGSGRDQGMVFGMATGRSTPCLPPPAAQVAPRSTICWYFLNDMVMNNRNNINGGKRVY